MKSTTNRFVLKAHNFFKSLCEWIYFCIYLQETLLECPILVDLDHGTVRHRHEERDNNEEEEDKVKIGYFYHPRLNDFSEGTIVYF